MQTLRGKERKKSINLNEELVQECMKRACNSMVEPVHWADHDFECDPVDNI